MVTTEEFISMGLYGSTLNKAQFEILGQPYPPEEGWKSTIIGKELSLQEINLFLLLRGKLSLSAQEQIKRNYQLIAKFHKKDDTKELSQPTKSTNKKNTLEIYCDGACQGNPGKAGSGLAVYDDPDNPTLLYGAYSVKGTNNTAELNALLKALQIASTASKATIFTDSKYSMDSIATWAYGWKRNGWKKKSGEIKNLNLIKTTHTLYDSIKDKVTIKYVKGHAGIEGNELADRMAVHAISQKNGTYQEYAYQHVDDVIG